MSSQKLLDIGSFFSVIWVLLTGLFNITVTGFGITLFLLGFFSPPLLVIGLIFLMMNHRNEDVLDY